MRGNSVTFPVSILVFRLHLRLNDPLVNFTIPKPTQTILVLSQSDTRFYQSIASATEWTFDFKLFKIGSKEVLGSSSQGGNRSVTLRIDLPAGDYIVHVRPIHRIELKFANASPLGAAGQGNQRR